MCGFGRFFLACFFAVFPASFSPFTADINAKFYKKDDVHVLEKGEGFMTDTINEWDGINSENVWSDSKSQNIKRSIPDENIESGGKIDNVLAAKKRDIEKGLEIAAYLYAEISDVHYPIYERMLREFSAINDQIAAKSQAQKVADRMKRRKGASGSSPDLDISPESDWPPQTRH